MIRAAPSKIVFGLLGEASLKRRLQQIWEAGLAGARRRGGVACQLCGPDSERAAEDPLGARE